MYDDSDSHVGEPVSGQGLSRRTLVRAGATAAWAVPAISIVTAAPALAVSGPAKLRILGLQVFFGQFGQQAHIVVGEIKNVGGTATGPITVTVTLTKNCWPAPFINPYLFDKYIPRGWKCSWNPSNPWTFTFVTIDGLAAGASSDTLDFWLWMPGFYASKKGYVTVTASTRGVAPAVASEPLPTKSRPGKPHNGPGHGGKPDFDWDHWGCDPWGHPRNNSGHGSSGGKDDHGGGKDNSGGGKGNSGKDHSGNNGKGNSGGKNDRGNKGNSGNKGGGKVAKPSWYRGDYPSWY